MLKSNHLINQEFNLQVGQTIGVITNYFTEQFLQRDFVTRKITLDNIQDLIENNNIEVVFVEDFIYEEDHYWFNYDFDFINEFLSKFNVNIIKINVGDYDKKKVNTNYFQLNLNPNTLRPEIKSDSLSLPLMINERIINPKEDRKTKDILFISIGEVKEDIEISQYIKRVKPIYTQITSNNITRNVIKDIINRMKKASVVYIYNSKELSYTLLKYLELAAVIQNTIIILDPELKGEFKYAFRSPVKESNTNYIQTFTNKGFFTDKKLISSSRHAFLNNTLIQFPSMADLLMGDIERQSINISVITSTMRKWSIGDYIIQLNNQNYVNLEVVLLTHGFELSKNEERKLLKKANFNLKIISKDESVVFGACLNSCINYTTYDYFTKMDDDDFYYPNYLIDSWITYKYSDAEVVGKYSQFIYLEDNDLTINRFPQHRNRFTDHIAGATIFCGTDFIKEHMFSEITHSEDSDFLERVRNNGGKIFCGHPFEFCVFRSKDKSKHTWRVPDTHLFRLSEILFYSDPARTLTVD